MNKEWCLRKLNDLKTQSNRLSILKDIRRYVKETRHLEIEITERLLSSPQLFSCLDEGQEIAGRKTTFFILLSDILRVCMDNFSLEREPFDVGRLLYNALTSKWIRIKLLAAQGLRREVDRLENEAYSDLNAGHFFTLELFHLIFKLARENRDNMLGAAAFRIFDYVYKYYAAEPTVKDVLVETLNKTQEQPDDALLQRLYYNACGVAMLAEANLEYVEFLFDHAVGQLRKRNNDDMQSEVLDMFGAGLDEDFGIEYLVKRGVFQIVAARLKQIEYHCPSMNLCLNIVKFFGRAARAEPKLIIIQYSDMMSRLFKYFYMASFTTLPTMLATIQTLISNEESVVYLEQFYPHSMRRLFRCFKKYLKVLPTYWRAETLYTLEIIFEFKDESDPEIEAVTVIDILHKWFKYLNNGTNTMCGLIEYCQNPDRHIKSAALLLVRVVCFYSWGIEALKNTPALLNIIVTRSPQSSSDTHYAQHVVIDALAEMEAFDPETINRFYQMLRNSREPHQ